MAQVLEFKTRKSKWNAESVAIATHTIPHNEYKKLVEEWAEVIYLQFCQLPEKSNSLVLELLPLRFAAEKVELPNAA